jgi:hypothetical protein
MRNHKEIAPNGLTYGEIDAREADSIRSANETLADLRDQSARWWNYSVSHCTFDMIVGDPLGRSPNMAICCPSTITIQGPICWHNQQLRVEWECNRNSMNETWSYKLIDEVSGFLLESNMFLWCKNFDLHANGSIWFSSRAPKRAHLEYVCPKCRSATYGHKPFCAQCGRELPSESIMDNAGLTRPVRDPEGILQIGYNTLSSEIESGTFNSDTNKEDR